MTPQRDLFLHLFSFILLFSSVSITFLIIIMKKSREKGFHLISIPINSHFMYHLLFSCVAIFICRRKFFMTAGGKMNHNLLDFYSATYWPLGGKWDEFVKYHQKMFLTRKSTKKLVGQLFYKEIKYLYGDSKNQFFWPTAFLIICKRRKRVDKR